MPEHPAAHRDAGTAGNGEPFCAPASVGSNRFPDFERFVEEQQNYRPVADAVALLLAGNKLSDSELQPARRLIGGQDIEPFTAGRSSDRECPGRAPGADLDADGPPRHQPCCSSSRSNGVKGFPSTSCTPFVCRYDPVPDGHQSVRHYGRAQNRGRARACSIGADLSEFEGDTGTWWNFDPRVEWLMGYLTSIAREGAFVICAKAATAAAGTGAARARASAPRCSMKDVDYPNATTLPAWFAQKRHTGASAAVLRIGSEDRNFQFASNLVMFDLPFNPDLLEQRIGRLDRIGQAHDIQIHVPYLEKTAQSVLVRWYHEGLDAFEHTCPTGRTVYDSVHDELINYLAAPESIDGFDDLIKSCRQQHDALKAQLEQGRDRLLEIHSNGGEKAQALAESIEEQDDDTSLIAFSMNLFDIVGINQDDRGENLIVLTPSDHMLVPDFPGLPEDGCTITFERDVALSREDAQFITWEHPLIRNGLDLILSGDTGNAPFRC